jgi:hypothetical protein
MVIVTRNLLFVSNSNVLIPFMEKMRDSAFLGLFFKIHFLAHNILAVYNVQAFTVLRLTNHCQQSFTVFLNWSLIDWL